MSLKFLSFIGATHFTLLAAVEVIGKSPWGLASGAMVDGFGWSTTFAVAVGLSVLFMLLLIPVSRSASPRG